MNGINKFLVYLIVAMAVYYVVLRITVGKRPDKPYIMVAFLAVFVTAAGMIFARITYGKEMPWWIFYGIPVLFTYLLAPVLLRMSRKEFLLYTPLALLAGPVLHIFFSFLIGWHEYMPLFYIPSFSDLIK